MFELSGFQRDLLYCIAGRDGSHGLEIKRALEDYGDMEVNHGQLYPNLDALVEKGYVTKGSIDDRTNSYGLTAEGRALLADRREWEGKQLSKADDE